MSASDYETAKGTLLGQELRIHQEVYVLKERIEALILRAQLSDKKVGYEKKPPVSNVLDEIKETQLETLGLLEALNAFISEQIMDKIS